MHLSPTNPRAAKHGRVLIALIIAALASLLLASCAAQPAPESEQQTPAEPLVVNDTPAPPVPDPEYILVIGDDSWEKYTPGHADLMMLMRLDFERNQITLVTVPRDTAYVFPDGNTAKLNQMLTNAGPEAQCEAVSDVVGVEVTNYVVVGFDGLQSIVEHFGGLDVNLPYGLTYNFYTKDFDDEVYEAGEQTLTPWRVMALSRARTGYGDTGYQQEMIRQVVDRQMMTQFIKLAYADPTQTGDLLALLQGFVTTNVSLADQQAWAEELASGDQITVYGTTGPYYGDFLEELDGLWLVPESPEEWKDLMDAVDAGKDPAPVVSVWSAETESPLAPVSTTTVIDLP